MRSRYLSVLFELKYISSIHTYQTTRWVLCTVFVLKLIYSDLLYNLSPVCEEIIFTYLFAYFGVRIFTHQWIYCRCVSPVFLVCSLNYCEILSDTQSQPWLSCFIIYFINICSSHIISFKYGRIKKQHTFLLLLVISTFKRKDVDGWLHMRPLCINHSDGWKPIL